MCIYWKKLHTCGHASDRPYIEMCRPGCLSNTVCPTISTEPTTEIETFRASHFPCYPCIKAEVRAEAEERLRAEYNQNIQRAKAVQRAEAVQREKQERVRREAREKAAKEREEEARMKAEREKEEEKAKREGGAWIESGGKKGKKAKGFPVMPMMHSGTAVGKAFGEKENVKENDRGAKMELEKGEDTGGRAGMWGPNRILSRKEGVGARQGQGQGQGGKK
jgi:hypothetical protein